MDIRNQPKEETITTKGRIILKLFDSNGQFKERRDISNLVVTVGKNFLANWLTTSESGGFMPYVALGSGTNQPTVSDTMLQTELSGSGYARANGTLSSASNVWQNVGTFTFSGTFNITEAGLFSALTGGTMFAHQVFTAIPVVNGNVLQVTWMITFS